MQLRKTWLSLAIIAILAQTALAAVDLVTIPRREATQLTIYNSEDTPYDSTGGGGDAACSARMQREVRGQVELLSSGEAKTRAAAAARLGRLGEASAPAVPRLIGLLTDHPPAKYKGSLPYGSPAYEALEAMVKIGKPAVPHLIAALKHEDERVRGRVIDVLGRIGDPVAKDRLLALTRDESALIRAHAALALGKIGGPDVLEPLLAAAKDPDRLAQRYAMDGLILFLDACGTLGRWSRYWPC